MPRSSFTQVSRASHTKRGGDDSGTVRKVLFNKNKKKKKHIVTKFGMRSSN